MKNIFREAQRLDDVQVEVAIVVASGFPRKVRIVREIMDWTYLALIAGLFAALLVPIWIAAVGFVGLLALRTFAFLRQERQMKETSEQVQELVSRLEQAWDEHEEEHHGGQ